MNFSRLFSTLPSSLLSFQSLPIQSFVQSIPPLSIPTSEALLPHYNLVKSIQDNPSDLASQIRKLPRFDPSLIIDDNDQIELATLLHAYLASAYYWHSSTPSQRIPSNISVPFCRLSNHLDRAPMISIVSTNFQNWKLKDESKEFHPDNIDSLFTFSGTDDETFFYHCGTYIEYLGNAIIEAIPTFYNGIQTKNEEDVKNSLKIFVDTLKDMKKALSLVFQRVDPNVFYFGFRRYLGSFDGVIYEGVSETPLKLMGSTAAQSPLVRLIDAIFTLNSNDTFLSGIFPYMKKEHRDFIAFVEKSRPKDIRKTVVDLDAVDEWNSVIEEFANFRKTHCKLAYQYIIKPSQGGSTKGTGGSSIESFLNSLIENTRKLMITTYY
uniref:Indoleamine 2,3-dioxyganese-I n=1 Tax=Blepharisma stoltei TaxID=1481888 RepID=A0A286T8B9_9CILI|nr:indoleamine 2,3-dioxyganese - I [Blepharisma stoltei]